MTDVLRIAHPQNCPPYGNSRVGICEIHLSFEGVLQMYLSLRERERLHFFASSSFCESVL